MKAWAKTGIILVAVLQGACGMAPGMKMTEPAEVAGGTVVRVTPITLDLLNQMEAAQSFKARKVAEEFTAPPPGYVIGVGDVLQVTVGITRS